MLDFVLNFLFPPVCGICGKLDKNWICPKCRKRLEKYEKFELIKSKKIINNLFNFQEEKIYFDEFLYCFEYKSLIRNLILKYKFSDCGYLSNLFANVIFNNEIINEIFKCYDIMIPVPMNKKKKKVRGYNQTELITNCLEKKLNSIQRLGTDKNKCTHKFNNSKIKFNNTCLIKIKNTKTQSTLMASERIPNIKNAFKITDIDVIENKNIILFDDIATTGSTINEISKLLKKNNVKKILVLVIAKD